MAESVIMRFMRFTGHRTREIFQRYNIVDDRDLQQAAAVLSVGEDQGEDFALGEGVAGEASEKVLKFR